MKKILIGWLAVSLAILVIGGCALSMNEEPVLSYAPSFAITSVLVLVTIVGVSFFRTRMTALWVLTCLSLTGFVAALSAGLGVPAFVLFCCLVECGVVVSGIALWSMAQPNIVSNADDR